MSDMQGSIGIEKLRGHVHQMLGFLLRAEANRTDNRPIHSSTPSKEILAARADEFGSKAKDVHLLQELICAKHIHLESVTQTLGERIAELFMNPCPSTGRHNCNFPFIAVSSVEAKVAVLMVREWIPGTGKQRLFRSCAIRAHDFASSLMSSAEMTDQVMAS
ncbi:hypothetical protein RsS62_00140 [Rhizobium dioscoreae]|nr:hypothetical protein RsS62_00140 [Rhizobium dioscoreae]GLU82339.1 hypothetical protein Rhsp01_35150 [Rhizobium sp. NBRC 114257]